MANIRYFSTDPDSLGPVSVVSVVLKFESPGQRPHKMLSQTQDHILPPRVASLLALDVGPCSCLLGNLKLLTCKMGNK